MIREIIESLTPPIKGDIVKLTNYGGDEEAPDKWVWNGAKGEIIEVKGDIFTVRITNLNNSNVKNSKRLQKRYGNGKKLRKTIELKLHEFLVLRPHEDEKVKEIEQKLKDAEKIKQKVKK